MSGIRIHHVEERRRYDLFDGDALMGSTHYRELFETDVDGMSRVERIFFHTVMKNSVAGQDLAGQLAGFAMADTVTSGTRIVAVCPQIEAFLARHHDFDANVIAVRPEHREALPRQ